MPKYLSDDGLLYFWQKIKTVFSTKSEGVKTITRSGTTYTVTRADDTTFTFTQQDNTVAKTTTTPKAPGTAAIGSETKYAAGDHVHPHDSTKVDVVDGKGLSTNDYTTAEKTKLSGIASGAEVNQNAFSNIKVGSTTVAADAKTDTVELVAGSNVTLTPDATNDKVTIAAIDTTYSDATTSSSGLMSASDKTKLDGITAGGEPNQNAFSNVKVGTSTIAADTTTDTLTIVAGDNVTITPDTSNDKITIAATDTTYTPASATPSMDGTGAVGSSVKYAREDHVHPTDTSRVPTTRKVNGKALSSDITLSASDVSAIPTSAKGAASGVCPLNASSKIDSTYLPSFVDDVIEAYARSGQTALSAAWLATESASGSVITPETGKIYVLMADADGYSANTQFRWSGSSYVKLNDGGVSAITNSEIDTILAA